MKRYLNLTNGLAGQAYLYDGYVRIQSTACEQKRWDFILQDLDNSVLMYLALGEEVVIVDGGRKPPRAIWQGLEWIRYVLERWWYGRVPKLTGRLESADGYFDDCYLNLDVRTAARLDYFKKFATSGKIRIWGHWIWTEKDGDYDYWVRQTRANYPRGEDVLYDEYEEGGLSLVDTIMDEDFHMHGLELDSLPPDGA